MRRLNLTLSRRKFFSLTFFAVRVSVRQIYKFERKKIRRSIFVLDEVLFKFGDGSYLVGSDRANFKSNKV